MIKNDLWKEKHLVALGSDGPEGFAMPWYRWCGFGYIARNGECKRKNRFLTETCWGSSGAGACASSAISHDEYSVGCYKGTCQPLAFIKDRKECSCSSRGWRFPFACSAANDQCAGHPCVWDVEKGKRFCNHAEKQNWNDMGIASILFLILGATCSILTGCATVVWLLMSTEMKASVLYK